MSAYRKKPVVIDAITFDELVEHGRQSGAPLPQREAQYDTPVADAVELMGDPTKVMVFDA